MSGFDLVLADAGIVTPAGVVENGWLGVRDGVIAEIGTGTAPHAAPGAVHGLNGAWLGPGFIDVHVHGSNGVDVMATDEDGLRDLARFFATRGVTSFLAGTSTAERATALDALRLVGRVGERVPGGASILGAYLEGPFLNPARKGAHDESLLRPIDRDDVAEYLDTGVIRAFVLAPELPGADWLITELVRRGITAVAGHTDATRSEIEHAHELGVTAITHTFNGMRGLHHREPGAAGEALLNAGLVCELIADGVHIAPELMPLFWRMKGAHGIALVTDANQAGGLPDGLYREHDHELRVEGGVGLLPDGTISSSTRTFDYDFRLFCEYAGISFDQGWPAASATPARIAGVADRKGSVEVGKDADLTALSPEGDVIGTAVAGEWLHIKELRAS